MSRCKHCLPVGRELMTLPGHCPQQSVAFTPPDVEWDQAGPGGGTASPCEAGPTFFSSKTNPLPQLCEKPVR